MPRSEPQELKEAFTNLKLADPDFATTKNIDVMLGGKIYAEIMLSGVLKENGLLAQNTKIGWIISGNCQQQSHGQRSKCLHTRIVSSPKEVIETEVLLQRFWEMDKEPRRHKKLTEEEAECEKIFKQSYRRLKNGRVQVKLPFKENPSNVLGESRGEAVARWLAMERKLEKNQQVKTDYMKAIKEYMDLDHMQKLKTSESKHKLNVKGTNSNYSCYYIRHHAVINEESKTTKTRIVFDASCKTSTKKSLNSILMVGPIQESLIVRLIKWRVHKYVLRGDISKMYRQVKVYDEDVDFQRLVFRFNKTDAIEDYCLNTLTFGTASAPFLAKRSLKQVAIDNKKEFPKGAEVIMNDFHVDDLLTGDESIEGVKQIWNQVTQILKSAH